MFPDQNPPNPESPTSEPRPGAPPGERPEEGDDDPIEGEDFEIEVDGEDDAEKD